MKSSPTISFFCWPKLARQQNVTIVGILVSLDASSGVVYSLPD